mgnify:CR=1 FL=1
MRNHLPSDRTAMLISVFFLLNGEFFLISWTGILGPMASRSSEESETNGQANRYLLQTSPLKKKRNISGRFDKLFSIMIFLKHEKFSDQRFFCSL